jgi:hypothetical protein
MISEHRTAGRCGTDATGSVTRRARRCAGLLACLLVTACRTDDSALVSAWLTCIECTDGELDTLKALVGRRPAIMDTLVAALLSGPSPARRAQIRRELLAAYPRRRPLPVDSNEYARVYADNAVAIYRTRAAKALAEIGGPTVRHALDSVLAFPADSLPPNVRATVQFVRDSVLAP